MPTKVKKTRVVKKKAVRELEYKASLKILGKVYTSTGSTVREAIENLKVEGNAKGVSILTVSKGDVKREKILPFGSAFRLLNGSRIMREIALKQISMLFSL